MIPQINIQQTMGMIGNRYTPSQLNIKTTQADLNISAPPAQLSITYTPSNLSIDQTQAFADEGLRSPLAFSQYEAAKGRQTVADGITSTADWTRTLHNSHNRQVLKQFDTRNQPQQVHLVPTLVPSPFSVKVHYQPGSVNISSSVSPVRITAATQGPDISFTPGVAKTYMDQTPDLVITPPPLGLLVDTKA